MTTLIRIFSEGFRVFFLAAGIFAAFAMLVWGLDVAGLLAAPSGAVSPLDWHAHEMIFGYGSAALGGFLLTAVPNWTGTPGARQGFVTGAALLWLAGRVAVWNGAALPPTAVAMIDLAFVPVIALKILLQLLKRPKPQNMMFLLFLTLFWVANLLVHLDWAGAVPGLGAIGLRAGLITLCALIAVLGGRITPAFTRNAMKRENLPEAQWPQSFPALEKASLGLALLLPMLVLLPLPAPVSGAAALALGAVQAARLARWRWRWCLTRPILLALHLALASLAAGMLVWGLARLGLGNEVAALHLLGIGAVGGMTLAVMSRAALGHSGRPLVAPPPVALAYLLIPAAALLRWAGAGIPAALLAAAALWVLAFGLFSLSLWGALSGPTGHSKAAPE